MSVKSIAWAAYPGKDVPKLLAFYKDALGLRVDRVHPSEADAELVEFGIGNDQWFTLMPEKFLGRPAGSGAGVVFEVDDIDESLNKVRAGAKSADEKPTDYGNCRIASFEDPEGNKVGLHQHIKERRPRFSAIARCSPELSHGAIFVWYVFDAVEYGVTTLAGHGSRENHLSVPEAAIQQEQSAAVIDPTLMPAVCPGIVQIKTRAAVSGRPHPMLL